MSNRKNLYKEGDKVYIIGNHVLRGASGEVKMQGNQIGSYYILIKGNKWLIRGRNISPKPIK